MAQRKTRTSVKAKAEEAAAINDGLTERMQPGTQEEGSLLQSIVQSLSQQQQILLRLTMAQSSQPAGSGPPPSTSRQPEVGPWARRAEIPHLPSPDSIDLAGFLEWKVKWSDYVSLTGLCRDAGTVTQQAVLRTALNDGWVRLWQAGVVPIADGDDERVAIQKLVAFLRKRRNPLLDRKAFHGRSQRQGESISQYFSGLSQLHDACSYPDSLQCGRCGSLCGHEAQLRETRLRDRLICGLRDRAMQRRVLEEEYASELSLDRVMQICSAYESATDTESGLGEQLPDLALAAATKSTYKRQQAQAQTLKSDVGTCRFCGETHPKGQCKAYNQTCRLCLKVGHFARVCQQRTSPSPGTTSVDSLFVNQAGPSRNKLVTVGVAIQGGSSCAIGWLPDTGADVDAISLTDLDGIDPSLRMNLVPDTADVKAANGTALDSMGKLEAQLSLSDTTAVSTLHVFRQLKTPLLSKDTCMKLRLLEDGWPHSRLRVQSVANISIPRKQASEVADTSVGTASTAAEEIRRTLLEEFPEVFCDTPLKPMSGEPMRIELINGASPCRLYRARSIPFRWRDAVQNQLSDMVGKGVIEKVPVGEAYTWCHPLVVVPKKNSSEPRITVDLTGLNKWVKRPAYPTRVPREVVASIPMGMQYFTTLDSRHGYWQVPLDDDSTRLTTFMTPWGAYRFKRNVMGLVSAGDEHNRRGDEVFAGFSNLQKVVEDVIVYDTELEAHTQRVRNVLKLCSENQITLNRRKFVFAAPRASYCGFVVTPDGYSPDRSLVEDLHNFPIPTNRTDIRSFCGLVQQFDAFTPRLAELLPPIRSLLSPKNIYLGGSAAAGIYSYTRGAGEPSSVGYLRPCTAASSRDRRLAVKRSRHGTVAAASGRAVASSAMCFTARH
ncbi:uncharacterized protein LOC135827906 [Sycon ciliatum]|uniref:uncharacterized protein LOC135827906 n=1 Tax=Sycon ciliatum TaxID=27933 RepID=UPI0031F66B67